jgi:CDP-4-dehydro-6-deoxyglucose reductase
MAIIKFNSSQQIEAISGESILDAAAKAELALPYSCRSGRCSACKCKQVSGESKALADESGLTEAEKAEGWILSCVRTAISDLELEVEADLSVHLPPVVMLPSRISEIKKLAADVMSVVLRLPPNAKFSFLPGQYVDVIGPDAVRRSYSLANADSGNKLLELHIRKVPDGRMSKYWFESAKENDLLRINGPLGTFFLHDIANRDLVFLATGTGIAPVKGMLEGLRLAGDQGRPRSISVFWGGRAESDMYWSPGDAACRFVPVLSRATAAWAGARGYVQEAFLSTKPDLANSVVYACGSDEMIHAAKSSLLAAGLPEKSFHSDAFVCSAKVNN